MFLKYNKPNRHLIPYYSDSQKKQKEKGLNIPYSLLALNPGWNNVPKAVWDSIKDHKQIKAFLDDEVMEIMNEEVEVYHGEEKIVKHIGVDDEPVKLLDLSESKAIKIAKDTHNLELLEQWHDEETRSKVKKVLAKQVKLYQPGSQEERED